MPRKGLFMEGLGMTEKKSRADDMRKSRANGTIIQVRLTTENALLVAELRAETGQTTTELINKIIAESKKRSV